MPDDAIEKDSQALRRDPTESADRHTSVHDSERPSEFGPQGAPNDPFALMQRLIEKRQLA